MIVEVFYILELLEEFIFKLANRKKGYHHYLQEVWMPND
jgi:hypothetical protein